MLSIQFRIGTDDKVDAGFLVVGPGPRAVDDTGDFAVFERRVKDTVVNTFGHDTVFDHAADFLHCFDRARMVHTGFLRIVLAVDLLKGIAALGGHDAVVEVGVVVPVQQRLLAAFGQLGGRVTDVLPGVVRRVDDVGVADLGRPFDRNRVAVGLAVVGHGAPEIVQPGLDRVARLDRREQTGLGPVTEAVVRPDENVRTFADGSFFLEFLGYRIRGFHGDGNTQFFIETITDGLQAIVALVGVDPDQQFTFFPGECGTGGGDTGHGQCGNECFFHHIRSSYVFFVVAGTALRRIQR